MSLENWLIGMQEQTEAERDARDEYVRQWADLHRSELAKGMLSTDLATLLCEVGKDDFIRLNHSLYLLMAEGETYELVRLINELTDAEMQRLALEEWQKRKREPADIDPEDYD